MKIKLKHPVNLLSGTKIQQGIELPVIKTIKLWFEGYEVTEGKYQGPFIHPDNCEVIPDKKTYTEQEWNDMENYYLKQLDKEREQKESANQLVKELTNKINKKNQEIERLDFFTNVLSGSLKAMTEAFHKVKSAEKS